MSARASPHSSDCIHRNKTDSDKAVMFLFDASRCFESRTRMRLTWGIHKRSPVRHNADAQLFSPKITDHAPARARPLQFLT